MTETLTWMVTLERGGVGPVWELTGAPSELRQEITRLRREIGIALSLN